MDPTSVVVILAAQLVCTGALFQLIGRRMPPHSGVQAFGFGAMVAGTAHLLLLRTGRDGDEPAGALLDTALLLALLLFITGVRQFAGRPAPAPRWTGVALLAFLVVRLAVGSVFHEPGRRLLVDVSLAFGEAALALIAILAGRLRHDGPRAPLRLLSVLMASLALLTLARSAAGLVQGPEALVNGPLAQAWFAGSCAVAIVLGPTLLWMVFGTLDRQLAELATQDALTRLLNRAGLDEALRRHFADRDSAPLSLLRIDIDHFGRINDGHGHIAGDAVLRNIARVLRNHVRGGDVVARTGGASFLIACASDDPGMARALGERLRSAAGEMQTSWDGRSADLRCTISVGISRPFSLAEELEAALVEAEDALAEARGAGRDRVAMAS